MITYTLKVLSIRKETNDTYTICFKQPALKKVKYKPGQYLTLIVNVNGRKYHRPYSFSSSPGIDTTLDITIKRVTHGIVSNHLIDLVKEGDLIEVMEPIGSFIYNEELNQDSEIYLWGAGSGITPLLSIIKAALKGTARKIVLAYSNASKDETIFYDQLIFLKNEYPDRFSLNLFCTKKNEANCRYGRINKDHISEFLMQSSEALKTIHYICGPKGLKEIVKKELIKHGLVQEQIFSEDFEHVVNENELKEVRTRTVQILKNEERFDVEVVRGKSILEAGLDKQINLPYSCQTGNCTLCKAKLLTGEVKIIGAEKPAEELKVDEFLLCCSYPLTDNIKIEIN